jgi:hypothetical protein
MVALGMVSKDFSGDNSKVSFSAPGCSTMSMLWPALGLGVDNVKMPDEEAPNNLVLHDLVRKNVVRDLGGSAAGVAIKHEEGGRTTVVRTGGMG